MSDTTHTTSYRWLNPDMLRWAREWRGRTLEEAATRARQTVETMERWERGDATPTVRQARDLAAFYNRHFLELLLPEAPLLPDPIRVVDYRTHTGARTSPQEWELQDILRWVAAQRLNALDLFENIGEEPTVFPASLVATSADNPEEVAEASRSALGFSIDEQVAMTVEATVKLPDELRRRFEAIGVLTLRRTELAALGVRGICFAEFPLPVVVCTKESSGAQAFSLVHEFGHVLLRSSGISGPLGRTVKERAERWCNMYAGAFLMPARYLDMVVGPRPQRPAGTFDDERLKRSARRMSVSEHAMLIRLVDLGYVDMDYYWKVKRPQFDAQEAGVSGGGAPEYYGVQYRHRQGDLYTGLVLEAWGTDRITSHNAAEYMGIRNLRHLDDIRTHFSAS